MQLYLHDVAQDHFVLFHLFGALAMSILMILMIMILIMIMIFIGILSRITLCCSIFLVMSSAVERYLAVCRPHHFRVVSIIIIVIV